MLIFIFIDEVKRSDVILSLHKISELLMYLDEILWLGEMSASKEFLTLKVKWLKITMLPVSNISAQTS